MSLLGTLQKMSLMVRQAPGLAQSLEEVTWTFKRRQEFEALKKRLLAVEERYQHELAAIGQVATELDGVAAQLKRATRLSTAALAVSVIALILSVV